MFQIVIYFTFMTFELSFYIGVVLTLSINSSYLVNGEEIDDFRNWIDRFRNMLDSIDSSLNSLIWLCMNA